MKLSDMAKASELERQLSDVDHYLGRVDEQISIQIGDFGWFREREKSFDARFWSSLRDVVRARLQGDRAHLVAELRRLGVEVESDG